MLIFIKTSLTFYTAEFYSLTDQLWLKVKRVADWMRCNIIYSKISQNSKTYEMKNIWLQNEKHMTLKSHSVHHVSNKACDLILTSVCMRHFLNLKLYQHWSDWFSYTYIWVFTHSQQSLWRHQLNNSWVCKNYIQKINLFI